MKNTKVCTKCEKIKLLSDFYKDKRATDGLCSQCIDCDKIIKHDYYLKYREETKKRTSNYYKKNKLEYKKYNKEYRLKNLDKIKKQRESKKDYIKQQRHNKYLETIKNNPKYNHQKYLQRKDYHKKYHQKYELQHKIELNKKQNEYTKKKKQENISFKILCNLRIRLHSALKGRTKSDTTKKLLGCSIDFLRNHLESQFKDDMNWSNYGKCGWVVDHIRPCASFDLSKHSEQRKCFHYSNLQPLWELENLEKSDKLL